jgi:hypothetical protein
VARTKALTRPVTRKQARSYNRTVPNGSGVTALAELNGKGAYKRRYQATRRVLKNGSGSNQMYTAAQKRAMKRMSPARRASFKKMLKRAPSISTLQKKKRRASSGKSSRTKMKPNRRTVKSTGRRAPLKKDFIEEQLSKGRSRKQAEASWKVAHGRHYSKTASKGAKSRKRSRTYGKGKYKAVKARIGPKSRFTYKYRKTTKSGKKQLRDIPDHALLGFKTRKDYLDVVKDMGEWGLPAGRERRAKALEKKLDRLEARRERAAERTAKRIRAGRGMFTPNDESSALSYEEFEDMKMRRNAMPKTGRSLKKKSTRKKKTRKKTTAKRTSTAKRRAAAKKAAATRKRNAAKRSAAAKKAARTRKRRGGTSTKRTTARRRRRVKRTTVGPRKGPKVMVSYAANKRRKSKKKRTYKKAITVGRQGHKVRIRYRANRMFKRNDSYVGQLTKSLKLGAVVFGGFVTHRGLTRLVDDKLMSQVDALNEGTLGKYRTVISALATAAVGIPATIAGSRAVKMPDLAAPIAGGMAASLLQSIIVTVMGEVAPEYAGYFSNYPNASGSAIREDMLGSYYTMPQSGVGAYYSFEPHQTMPASGMGAMLSQAAAGMGQPMLSQAAAGMHHSMGQPMLSQAAAGMGQPMLSQAAAGMHHSMGQPMLSQAAAGMGQPMLTQAAAGTGEYVAYAANGIGEYEETSVSASPMSMDEGIHPNMHSAEQALTVAEAAAGIGGSDIALQSTVEPTVIADPISDAPGGSRAGVFQGGDGIFA